MTCLLYTSRNLKITLTRDGKNAYQSSTLPFKLVNMIGAPASESAESLTAALNQLGGTSVDAKEGGKMDTADKLLQMGMKLVSSDSNYSTEKTGFSLKLSPTEDPVSYTHLRDPQMVFMGQQHIILPCDGDRRRLPFVLRAVEKFLRPVKEQRGVVPNEGKIRIQKAVETGHVPAGKGVNGGACQFYDLLGLVSACLLYTSRQSLCPAFGFPRWRAGKSKGCLPRYRGSDPRPEASLGPR